MKKKKKKGGLDCYYLIDEYAERAGGIIKLTVLLQKRARELIKGMPRLIEIDSDSPVEIAFEEFRQHKISLVEPDEMLIASEETENKKK
ncbi:MAG: DNA-directed RNA polymerase subunit omega [Candidatus Anammoxibacter sp.]